MSGDAKEPNGHCIDDLIVWLRLRRSDDPDAPFAELLSGQSLDPGRLVDLACIDLIERRRLGRTVAIEDYLREFPSLACESSRLDLIDAELCVTRELGGCCNADDLIARFPDLATSIRELMNLEVGIGAQRRPDPGNSFGGQASVDRVFPGADPSRPRRTDSSLPADDGLGMTLPIAVPDWFVAGKTIAHQRGRWLIQGRDAKRGIPLAMKVIELPRGCMRSQRDQLLDACESASRVQNRNWVAPIVAAIAGEHLAIVRPWVFATPWPSSAGGTPSDLGTLLRRCSEIAYTLQAAHDAGATHGALHAHNLLINHDGRIQLVDAICSDAGMSSWMAQCDPGQSAGRNLQTRIAGDTRSLIAWIASQWTEPATPASTRSSVSDSPTLVDVAAWKRVAVDYPGEACGRIGDQLLQQSERLRRGNVTLASPFRGIVSRAASRVKNLRRGFDSD
jgi:hypothetical protein